MAGEDLVAPRPELHERLATRPGVLPTPHCTITEVGLAIGAGVEQNLLLDCDGSFE